MQIIASIKGLPELQAKLSRMVREIPVAIADAINNTADDVTKQISEKTPVGSTTLLKNSWHPQYASQTSLIARVGTHLVPHYGPDVEFGTRPHRPPVKALKEWARKKLGNENAAYAVAKAIAKRGTKPQKMFQEGTTNVHSILESEVKVAADRIINI